MDTAECIIVLLTISDIHFLESVCALVDLGFCIKTSLHSTLRKWFYSYGITNVFSNKLGI